MAAGQPVEAVVVGAEKGHRRMAIMDGGDIDGRPFGERRGGQRVVEPSGGGSQVAVVDQQQLILRRPMVEVEILGIRATGQQDE